MTTVLGLHLIWCNRLFGCTVFDVAVQGSSLSDGAQYNRTLRPFAHPVRYSITVRQYSGLGLGVDASTSLQG